MARPRKQKAPAYVSREVVFTDDKENDHSGFTEQAYQCSSCSMLYVDDGTMEPLYECSQGCGNFLRSESANENHQCSQCNKFGSKITAFGCPDCSEECEETEAVRCDECSELIREDEFEDHCETEHAEA